MTLHTSSRSVIRILIIGRIIASSGCTHMLIIGLILLTIHGVVIAFGTWVLVAGEDNLVFVAVEELRLNSKLFEERNSVALLNKLKEALITLETWGGLCQGFLDGGVRP